MNRISYLSLILCFLSACGGGGGGGSGSPEPGNSSTPSRIIIDVNGATNGIFDPAPVDNGSGTLWMSFSVVGTSPNDAVLPHISTRIAGSTDGGLTWTANPVIPNSSVDLQVPDGNGGTLWATWQYEVSRLVYDPYTTDDSRRWKLLWHRYLEADINGDGARLFEHGWIGVSTAPSPAGPWAPERKLFVGSGYDTNNNSTIGVPEYDLAALYPATAELGQCIAFTEPSALVTTAGFYISLKCATGGIGKVVLIRCDSALSDGSCEYVGDLIDDSEAVQFEQSGNSFSGFSATELAASSGKNYLIVTPTESPGELYRGCLVFEIADLATAALRRDANDPVLVKRVEGTSGSFNGACGYTQGAQASGILFSELNDTTPQFRIFASKIHLP